MCGYEREWPQAWTAVSMASTILRAATSADSCEHRWRVPAASGGGRLRARAVWSAGECRTVIWVWIRAQVVSAGRYKSGTCGVAGARKMQLQVVPGATMDASAASRLVLLHGYAHR